MFWDDVFLVGGVIVFLRLGGGIFFIGLGFLGIVGILKILFYFVVFVLYRDNG